MKKNIVMISLSIIGGILITFFVLNKNHIYAKEEYTAYAFQVGAYASLDNAESYAKTVDSAIIIKEDDLYKIYTAIYEDIDLVNEMVTYYENNKINVYLKLITVNKNFFEYLQKYETLIKKSDQSIYSKINQGVLDLYLESQNYEEIN